MVRTTAAATIFQAGTKDNVLPNLVVVVTDARHYADLSENIFRFLPLRLDSGDLKRSTKSTSECESVTTRRRFGCIGNCWSIPLACSRLAWEPIVELLPARPPSAADAR